MLFVERARFLATITTEKAKSHGFVRKGTDWFVVFDGAVREAPARIHVEGLVKGTRGTGIDALCARSASIFHGFNRFKGQRGGGEYLGKIDVGAMAGYDHQVVFAYEAEAGGESNTSFEQWGGIHADSDPTVRIGFPDDTGHTKAAFL
jgi:hypothetical protein